MQSKLMFTQEAIERGPLLLSGELDPQVFELDEAPDIRPASPLRYELRVEKRGQQILVRGQVEAEMELECARSGLFYSTIVEESAFLRDYSIPDSPHEIDLTEELRESVLLNVPAYPVSPEARSDDFRLPELPSRPQDAEDPEEPGSSPWDSLDNLNL